MRKTHLKSFKTSDIKLGSAFYVSIWTIPVIICAFCGGYFGIFITSYFFALMHEGAHILCARCLKVGISRVTVYPFGICARLERGYINSSEKEFLIAFAGPLMSLILFWVCTVLGFRFCADINLALCCVNLIPSLPLDGGRILKSMITPRFGMIRAYNFMLRLSKALIVLLLAFSAAIFFAYRFNFSLILVSAFLLQNLCCEQQAVSVMTLRELLGSRIKLSDAAHMPARVICVPKERPARTLLNLLSYDRFHVIHIADSSGKIIRTVTETEVLTSLMQKNICIKYADV